MHKFNICVVLSQLGAFTYTLRAVLALNPSKNVFYIVGDTNYRVKGVAVLDVTKIQLLDLYICPQINFSGSSSFQSQCVSMT